WCSTGTPVRRSVIVEAGSSPGTKIADPFVYPFFHTYTSAPRPRMVCSVGT
ncbi:MAG: hypothetical protein AVDCRST_MAG68-4476, partial [uncultured Gemmatimonadetes bacterium]